MKKNFNLFDNFQKACHDYIRAFEEKQDMCFEFWIADRIGSNADFGGWTIPFSEIRYDIDNGIEKGKIIDYQEFAMECYELGDPIINYRNWLKLKS